MSEAIREPLPENRPELEVLPREMPEPSMKWHGFLAKFYLWPAAAYHLFQAAWVLSGRIYIETAARDAVYASMPGMRILDLSLGGILGIGAVLQILSAVHLIKKHRAGIGLQKGAYILLTLAFIAYLTARMLISGMPPLSLSILGQAVSCAALLLVNISYYRKRTHVFNPRKE